MQLLTSIAEIIGSLATFSSTVVPQALIDWLNESMPQSVPAKHQQERRSKNLAGFKAELFC
jgi:hypothetical protein